MSRPICRSVEPLSMAFLVLLERVTPVERAVFLFREVFDLRLRRDRGRSWQERGELPADRGSGPAADRRRKPRLEASRRRREELAVRFFEAVGDGDAEGLIRMLAADAVAYADGGGKTRAFVRCTGDRITRILLRFGTWLEQLGAETMRPAEVNGQPGAVFLGDDGRPVLVLSLDIGEGLVQTIRAVSNPEKLCHLGPDRWSSLAG
jgi:RNA polymerase sigma-70 factor, ECF subfamily